MRRKNLPKDICAGIIIMAVSIPISMGYAQIAGLPAVYGLYGSVFPILLFALFSTSPQFIFGVDAAPAALIGGALIDLHIESGSEAALKVVPVLTLFVAVWLLAFYLMKAGKLVNYISAPVMGGFYYRNLHDDYSHAGTETVWRDCGHRRTFGAGRTYRKYTWTDPCSVPYNGCDCTGNSAGGKKKLIPKFPMAVVLMAVGALMTKFLPVREWGIQTLSAVQTGLPRWKAVDLSAVPLKDAITISLSVAVVIMAETLLAENNFAQKNRYRINDNQELLAFSLGNFAAALTGCCPINGPYHNRNGRTVSGENPADRNCGGNFHDDSAFVWNRIYRISSGSGATAIVISALLGATEFELAVRLWKVSRTECLIFWCIFWSAAAWNHQWCF